MEIHNVHCATVRFTSEHSYKWIKWWKALFKYACDVEIDRWEVKLLTTYLPFNYSWQNVKIHHRPYLPALGFDSVREHCSPRLGLEHQLRTELWMKRIHRDPGLITLFHMLWNIQHLWGYDLWAGNHTGHSCIFKSIRGLWRFHGGSLKASKEAKHKIILFIILDPHS